MDEPTPSFPRRDRQIDVDKPGEKRLRRDRAETGPRPPEGDFPQQKGCRVPSVWLTRASDPDSVEAKWRVKRVWEEQDEAPDNSEPVFEVAQRDLDVGLRLLLGVPIMPTPTNTPTNTPTPTRR